MPDRIPHPCRAGHPALTKQGYSAARGSGACAPQPWCHAGTGDRGAGSKLCCNLNDRAAPPLFLCVQFEKFRPSIARWSLYRACQASGVDPVFADYQDDDPVGFVVSLNLHRRHLDESQRAISAAKAANHKVGNPNWSNSTNSGLTTEQASDKFNVGKTAIKSAKQVIRNGIPKLTAKVESGQVRVSTAADIATLPPKEQNIIVGIIPASLPPVRARYGHDRAAGHTSKPDSYLSVPAGLPSGQGWLTGLPCTVAMLPLLCNQLYRLYSGCAICFGAYRSVDSSGQCKHQLPG